MRQLAVDGLGDALMSQGGVFASDDDPELVRAALPFGLKTIEALIEASPDNVNLRLAACSGFTQYSRAFVEGDANLIEWEDYEEATRLKERALKLYLRARDWGLSGLEIGHPGLTHALRTRPNAAAQEVELGQVDLLYWTAAAWGAAISLGVDRPGLVADIDAVRAMLARVLALDETFGDGAIYETLISVECLPSLMGGDHELARKHFERAVELTGGHSASPYVAMAGSACLAAKPREFVRLLETALRIDPDAVPHLRLSNLLALRRAAYLLQNASELFLEPIE